MLNISVTNLSGKRNWITKTCLIYASGNENQSKLKLWGKSVSVLYYSVYRANWKQCGGLAWFGFQGLVPGCSWQGELSVLTRWNIQLHNSGVKREKDTQSKFSVTNSCIREKIIFWNRCFSQKSVLFNTESKFECTATLDVLYFIGTADESFLLDLVLPGLQELWAEVREAGTSVV